MNENPVQLIVAAFQNEREAKAVLKSLKRASRERVIRIEAAAVLRKDSKGKLHIKETHDMGGRKGAAIGGVAGAAIGILAGPALAAPAAVGALVGGLSAKLRDTGFPNDRLRLVGEGLQPGSSAIVAVVEHRWVEQVEKAMAEEGANVIAQALGADIAAQLEAGHDVAYMAVASQSGFMAGRLTAGEEEAEGESIVIDDSGIYGARFLATREGFAVQDTAFTEAGYSDEVSVLTGQGAAHVGSVAADEPEPESDEGE